MAETETTIEQVATDDLKLTEEYQVMNDPIDDIPRSLKTSIDEDGFDQSKPLTVDEKGTIIDGHHRLAASREAGIETVPVVRKRGLTDDEKRKLAFGQNLRRRNLDGNSKREHVKRYLKEEYDDEEQTQSDVADLLGVSPATVSRARDELAEEGVDKFSGEKMATETREEKRERIQDHIEANPEASNRGVADELDVSKTTVGKVRDVLEDKDDTETEDNECNNNLTSDETTIEEEDAIDDEGVDSVSDETDEVETKTETGHNEDAGDEDTDPPSDEEITIKYADIEEVFRDRDDKARPLTADNVAEILGCNRDAVQAMLDKMTMPTPSNRANDLGLHGMMLHKGEVGREMVYWQPIPSDLKDRFKILSHIIEAPIFVGWNDEDRNDEHDLFLPLMFRDGCSETFKADNMPEFYTPEHY